MTTCTVCGTQNADVALICTSCKSYLRSKVDNLDLFSTIWKLVESPRQAFQRIVHSEHKNYVILLSALFGISLAYTILWYKNLGGQFSNIFTLTGTGAAVGVPLGVMFNLVFSYILLTVARMFGGKASLKNTLAVVAYASAPIVFSLVLVFPIEVAIFGLDFFGKNPPPLVINPVVYVTLLGLDFAAFVWAWLLLVEGFVIENGFTRGKSIAVTLVVMALTALAAVGIYYL